jgi:hypothetical protein
MSYFVESLPSSCFFCDCCHEREYDIRYKIVGEKFCGIENIEELPNFDEVKIKDEQLLVTDFDENKE